MKNLSEISWNLDRAIAKNKNSLIISFASIWKSGYCKIKEICIRQLSSLYILILFSQPEVINNLWHYYCQVIFNTISNQNWICSLICSSNFLMGYLLVIFSVKSNELQQAFMLLILFLSMFPFDPPKNIRKPNVQLLIRGKEMISFWMFSERSKENIGRKGLKQSIIQQHKRKESSHWKSKKLNWCIATF